MCDRDEPMPAQSSARLRDPLHVHQHTARSLSTFTARRSVLEQIDGLVSKYGTRS